MNSGYTGKLDVVAVGDELALIFPQELIDRLQVRVGDTLYLQPTETGYLMRTTPVEPEAPSSNDQD
jgi:hypothetical protein